MPRRPLAVGRPGPGEGEPERRCHRRRPSARGIRRARARRPGARAEAARRRLRRGRHLHRRGPGAGGGRGGLTMEYVREEPDPPLDYPPYKSTALRHPKQPLVYLPHTITETTGPQLGQERVLGPADADLTRQHDGEPIGERMTVTGRVLDTDGRP